LPRGDIGPGIHWIGGCVGPTVSLCTLEKREISCLYQKLNHIPPVVQPIASSLYQLSYRSSTLEAAVYIPISSTDTSDHKQYPFFTAVTGFTGSCRFSM
jgi:hypothetical protein